MKTLSINVTLLTTRLILAIVIGAHGTQKLFGWFGGFGFDGTMGFFTNVIGLPYTLGASIILIETIGMLALALGFLGRIFSVAVIGIMIGAIVTVHAPFGFYMNWFGNQTGEGFEFHLIAIGLSIPVLLLGSGVFSLDHLLFSKKKDRKIWSLIISN